MIKLRERKEIKEKQKINTHRKGEVTDQRPKIFLFSRMRPSLIYRFFYDLTRNIISLNSIHKDTTHLDLSIYQPKYSIKVGAFGLKSLHLRNLTNKQVNSKYQNLI